MEQAPRKRLNPRDYTVVWVAPLLIEAKACFGVLDERHNGYFEIHGGQDYNFSGGSLNGHNIIVATFPRGENYGTVSAAALFNQVKMIFPTKFVLLVGVAAGVPKLSSIDSNTDKDIRLGDVLVSVPDKKGTGVVAYDSGTQTDDDFIVTSRQSGTLRLFRSTYELIELNDSDPYAEGGEFAAYLSVAQAKLKTLYSRDNFEHPDWKEDILHAYVDDKDSEGTPVYREPRAMPERPQIWYGNIGSGNRLMRNHKERDRLRDKYDLIGLEMEAAGVINFSQAAVIRGVCDYGDKKKNKNWQGYAAAVAAVYAKGVLMLINPMNAETQRQGHDPLMYSEVGVEPDKAHRENSNEDTKRKDEFSGVTIDSKEGRAVLKWLSKHNYVDRYQRCLANHQQGTASWVFETTEYRNWRRGGVTNLLLKGHPGTGKSVITALIAQRAQQVGHATAVVFFSRDEDRHLDELHYLAAMVRQLIERSRSISSVILQIFRSYLEDASQSITKQDILAMLESEIKRCQSVCFVIDALDECARQERLSLLMHLSSLQKTFPDILTVMSTRKIDDIIAVVTNTFPTVEALDVIANEDDIKSYIEEQFRARALLQPARRYEGLYKKLERHLMHQVDGMFLLVILRCQLLESHRPKTQREFINSITDICKAQTLRDTYVAMWRQILKQDYDQVEIAKKVFMWICFSIGPMTIEQLRHAVAAQNPLPTRDSDDHLLHQDLITEPCLGLLIITGNGVVGFMHVTARETFPNLLRHELQDPQQQMCQTCLGYLGQKDLDPCITDEQIVQRLIEFPFLSYAVKAWSHHAVVAENRFRRRGLLKWLSDTHSIGRTARIAVFLDPSHVLVLPQLHIPTDISAQHLLAFFGMTDVLNHLLQFGLHPSPFDTPEWNFVLQAFLLLLTMDFLIAVFLKTVKYSLVANNGWTVVVGFLTETCMYYLADRSMRRPEDSDIRDSNGWTPLRYAAWRGHLDVMKMLCSAGTEIDTKDVHGDTALMWALGERTTSQILHPTRTISSSGNVRLHIGSTYKLPACASYPEWIMPSPTRFSDRVIAELIRSSKRIDSRNQYGRTPLIQAANNRQFRHVQRILNQGADIGLADDIGLTALLAAVKCQPEVYEAPGVELHGMDSMHVGDHIIFDAGSAQEEDLEGATVDGIIGRLIGQRTVNVQDEYGRTALAYAMANGQAQVVTDLLAGGANRSCIDFSGQTPSMWAQTRGKVRWIITGQLSLSGDSRLSQGAFFELRGRDADQGLLNALSATG